MEGFRRILYCTDFSDTAEKAFDYALELSRTYGAELILFHAVHQPVYPALAEPYFAGGILETAEERLRQEALEEIRNRYLPRIPPDLSRRVLVHYAPPAQEILRVVETEGIDLVVMGTRGRSPVEMFVFGSVAQRVIRRCPCPVLTVSPVMQAKG
jgi:nucleotide-binding universal stress UspA family protein